MKASSPKYPPPSPPILDDPIWTPKDFTDHIKVKVGTFYSWKFRRIDLPPSFQIGGVLRMRRSAVLEWLKEKEKERMRRDFEA